MKALFLVGNALIRASHLYFFKKVLSLRRNAYWKNALCGSIWIKCFLKCTVNLIFIIRKWFQELRITFLVPYFIMFSWNKQKHLSCYVTLEWFSKKENKLPKTQYLLNFIFSSVQEAFHKFIGQPVSISLSSRTVNILFCWLLVTDLVLILFDWV